jgi:hypothetical protein
MSQYLYAIVDRLPDGWCPPVVTIGAAPATIHRFRDLFVIVSPVERAPAPGQRGLAVHHEVVASAMDAPAVLPVRFGTVLADGQLTPWLEARWDLVKASLDRFRGRLEMNVKLLRLDGGRGVTWRGRPADRATAAAEAARLRTLGDRLVEQADVGDWCYRPAGHDGNAAASVAFLLARTDVDVFLTRIAPIASHAEGVAVVPTGPWPPYSFTPALDRETPVRAAPRPSTIVTADLLDRRAG